jgi:uncharacterized protein DUF1707
VIARREDGKTAAATGRLRASSADRDQAIDVLKVAFVQGRLSMDEFDARIGQVLTSRTQAELAVVTADIPAGLAGVRRPGRPPRRPTSNAARWGASGFITPAILAAGLAAASLGGGGGWAAVAVVIALGYFIFWLSAGAELLWQWHCMSVPGNGMCVRCAHTAAAHRKPASCTVRPGALKRWEHCACTRYVPPGVLPEAADLSPLPSFPS